VACVALKILGVRTAKDLAEAAVCAGLANNFAAIRAMAKEGIQAGHMRLHAANIAMTAGATHDEVPVIVRRMIEDRKINVAYATELLEKIRGHGQAKAK
jgi:hydroxymethylglutaryl-CoA reductase